MHTAHRLYRKKKGKQEKELETADAEKLAVKLPEIAAKTY